MTKFKLNMGSAMRHDFCDSLPEFAQGYLEAAFSSGIFYYYESGDVIKITGIGPHDTPAGLLAGMAGDAIRFQIEKSKELTVVYNRQGYDMRMAGKDFWFTRNSYAGAYWDQQLDRDIDGVVEAMHSLRVTAHGMGEFSLYAEPLHASPDPLDASDWEVESDVWPDVATAEQWAAVNPASKSAPNKET